MPNAQHNPAINARRFAALLAGFDTGNGSEAEALAKGRALRRMAVDAGMRVVDALELPEVKRAVDDQMGPARSESPALQEALEHSLALQTELTERTRDVRKLAELLGQQDEKIEELCRELAVARSARPPWVPAPAAPAPAAAAHVLAWPSGVDPGMALLAALLTLALLIAAILGGGIFTKEGTAMDWDTVRQYLRVAYMKAAQFALYQTTVLYIIACIAAGRPIGPASYAAFLYRMFTFR